MKRRAALWRVTTAAIMAFGLTACAVRPSPISEGQFITGAVNNLNRLTQRQEPIAGAISLGEAMARALKYNLELRIKREQASLETAKLRVKNYSLLPKLVADSGYVHRNNIQASTSLNLGTNKIDGSASSSQDRSNFSSTISFGWDILDFGLSYIRAQQAADDALIADEMRRGTLHKLMEDVRVQYWRATTYQRLIERLKRLESRTDRALQNSARVSSGNQVDRLVVLNSERELLKIKQAITELESDLVDSKAELARLMNMRPDTVFSLDLERLPHKPVKIDRPLDDILLLAVSKRPELRQNAYSQRINVKEAQINVLKMVPSLRPYVNGDQNSNSFLLNSDWVSIGAAMSWNLLNVFQYPANRKATQIKQQVLDLQAQNLTMTVITQVYLGLIRYDFHDEKLENARRYLSVQKRLTNQMRLEAKAARVSEQEVILEEMNELIAEAKYDIAYADMQRAYGELISSLGLEYNPTLTADMPIDALAHELDAGWNETLLGLQTSTSASVGNQQI